MNKKGRRKQTIQMTESVKKKLVKISMETDVSMADVVEELINKRHAELYGDPHVT